MPVIASEIIDRVRTQLIDDGAQQRWSDEELLRWLSDGERTVVVYSPSLGAITSALQLAPGTRQTLPDTAFQLIDIKRNMGTDGETPGRVVRLQNREALDATDPNWHNGPRSSTTFSYIYDPSEPLAYYVWPPSNGTNFLEVCRAEVPVEITTLAQAITVPDLYRTALFDYVMFRAHQKDSDYAAGNAKAEAYLQLFANFMGLRETASLAESPNRQLGQPNLDVKGAAK